MHQQTESANRRILVIDDNPDIHLDFQKILRGEHENALALDAEASAIFGKRSNSVACSPMQLDSAYQGREGLQRVNAAKASGNPYAVAFVDMRMPPGWDGLTTIKHLWEVDPQLEVVICTAYSDRSWDEIIETLGHSDRLLILKKPFDVIEVLQIAESLTKKWNLARWADLRSEALERMVADATSEIVDTHRSKLEFISNVSHELLTPLNGVMGMCELLGDSELNEEQQAYLDDLSDCSTALHRLIREILDFNSLEANNLQAHEDVFDPIELMEEIRESVLAEMDERGLEMRIENHLEPHCPVIGDVRRVRQIISKLVENAVKFSEQGVITCRLTTSREDTQSKSIEFTIVDEGIGIDPDHLEVLNRNAFCQVNGGIDRSAGGIGMGLTMARRLAELLGGEVSIRSLKGKGTRAMFAGCFKRGQVCEQAPDSRLCAVG